jgi:hypothetical protein
MTTALKRNECKRQCRYNYTRDERLEKGQCLADEYGALELVNADLERVKKDFKARIETHEAKIQDLAEKVRSGYELRETLCVYTYDEPKPGRKTLRRFDTQEVIAEEDMTGADTQHVMETIEEQVKEAGADGIVSAHPFPDMPASKPKRTSSTPRRTSSSGVVATAADGEDLSNPDDNKATQ